MAATGFVFHRTRTGSKLGVEYDQEGQLIQVESREDEDQSVKLAEILELLLVAGYFRARIKGLSPFDKVVGGMTWCITTCNFDIDVDLLFQENSTIGQKISLTEKIVSVLPKMKCPHRLEPHQIQGLDFIHIFPVIQWLVKRAIETREEMGDYVRSFSISQFQKSHTFPEDKELLQKKDKAVKAVLDVLEVYKPERKYRRQRDAGLHLDEESRVHSTLLEYGRRYGFSKRCKQNKEEEGEISMSEAVPDVIAEVLEEDNLQAAEELKVKHAEVKACNEEAKRSLLEATEHSVKLESKMKSLEEIEEQADSGLMETLRALVMMNENLKQQEQQFRTHCKEEMARLQQNIEEIKSASGQDTEEEERSQLIDQQHNLDREKLQKIRLLMARRNREVAILQRKIDEVPSRAELTQYQKRFIELYSQVSATHKETKQFFTLYNTLDDKKLYLEKEVNLLNSIHDNFQQAMSSAAAKDQFLRQMEQIVEGIKQSRIKMEKKKQENKMRRDQLNDEYLELLDKQRLYFKTVKDFKEECRKNEMLLSKLRAKGAS
ncbi:coiled-coil domain-containing protein 93 isoform X3 [Fundulus heteroclitus]|uniref:coiled-coil domain-containing protein 93 isoform X3 n=1 Tax=Fundulus heteroclitus TaxID=8078 RepID=UPI00165CD598|nr:coiled-coil domain-containing protein 93 isoform X3 [Fundulus heteroclitus]